MRGYCCRFQTLTADCSAAACVLGRHNFLGSYFLDGLPQLVQTVAGMQHKEHMQAMLAVHPAHEKKKSCLINILILRVRMKLIKHILFRLCWFEKTYKTVASVTFKHMTLFVTCNNMGKVNIYVEKVNNRKSYNL